MDASHRPSPAAAIPSFEQPEIKGSALAFPGDAEVTAVLELAAEFHARRPDRWLRLQTVFHALIEKTRMDASLSAAIPPIGNAVNLANYQYEQAFATFFSSIEPTKPPVPFESIDISPRVLNALETARELAVATRTDTSREARVGVLHLAGALLSRRVDGDNELAAMGFRPQELRLALIHQAEANAEPGEIWREALGEEESLQAGRPLDLNSDEPEAVIRLDEEWRTDPLSIRRDVETFGALLASRSLQPPLSIGLFGPWGSGKTTFLKRLRRVVERRAEEAKNSLATAQPAPYVSEVVHVDFNAWHFAEDALTSSLVDTILRAVNDHIRGNEKLTGRDQQQQSLEKLETTKRKVEAAKELERVARESVSEAQAAFVTAGQQAANAAASFQNIAQGVWSATRDAFVESSFVKTSGILDAVGDTITSTEELGGKLAALRSRPARLLSDLGWPKSLMFAALVLVAPPLTAWLMGSQLKLSQVPELLASIAATLSVIGVWARAAAGAVAKVDKAATKVADEYAKRIATDTAVITKRQELQEAQANLATAESGLQAAREELARAGTAAANATIPAQMLHLASSRIDAQTYNKELTTLSLARADLEALSSLLRDQQTETSSPSTLPSDAAAPKAPIRPVDRVILYIDDLDRCKPKDVVRVLQLVHMLLAFELFVVVVAVDARWVGEALRQSYPWLGDSLQAPSVSAGDAASSLTEPGIATPQDYLEKIFQIAFWLEPMSVSGAASYLV
jgi:hypothetical protein